MTPRWRSLSPNQARSVRASLDTRARWPKSGLFPILTYFGETFIKSRIARWSAGPEPAIEQVHAPRSADDPYPLSWRTTERGRLLLADGLDGPEDCPEVLIGGYSTDSSDPWCCATAARGWWLQPCS